MIDKYYKNFKVKDYMKTEENNNKKDIIDCSLGTNPYISERRIHHYIKNAKTIKNKYDLDGNEKLKKELLYYYKDILHPNVNKNNISFGSGTMGILRNMSEFLIHENTKVLGIAPQFTRFISEVEIKKGIYEYYKLEEKNNYKFIVDDFLKKINKKYDLIYIDNPNNPTGQIIEIQDIEKIVKLANKNGIITIIDEAYGDYMKIENSSISLVEKYKNIVVIRSASKFYGLPNHRIGYIFASKEFIKIYNEISIPFPFSDLSANIFINALKDYKKIEKTKEKVIRVNREIYKKINKEKYLYTNEETPIFTLKTQKNIDISKKLLENKLLSESGNNFLNLNKKYTRIRINKNYKEMIKIINKI